MLVLVFLGVPVAFSMGLVAAVGIVTTLGPSSLMQMANIAFGNGTDNVFIVVPLFILMAGIISHSGIAEAVFNAASKWFNWVPGSLAVSTLLTSTAFAAVSGSSPATAATVGIFAVPEMIRNRYPRWMAVGSVAAGGTLGILIPPSINMVIYGIITETSIGKLFLAGIIPGLVLALILILFTVYHSARLGRAGAVFAQKHHVSWVERFSSLRGVIGVVLLFILVIGSIYAGVATPTEAAAVGAGGAIAIAVFYRKLSLPKFKEALGQSVETTAMIMFLLIGGFSLSFLISSLGIGDGLVHFLVALHWNRWVILGLFNLLLLILGSLMDPGSIIVITMPLLFPLFVKMGFDPVWLGVVLTINVEIGMISPPVGLNLFVLNSVLKNEVSMGDIIFGSSRYIGVMLLGLLVMIGLPVLSLWLPQHSL